MNKNRLLWIIAFALTLVLAVYQRLSGPTHPIRGTESIAGVQVKYRLLRSWTSHRPLPVRVSGDGIASMRLHHRRYPLVPGEEWSVAQMVTYNGAFQAFIPGQPAAGKVAYKVEVISPGRVTWIGAGKPVVARFKNEVPAWLLVLHVVFMFAALMLAFRAGLGALLNDDRWQRLVTWVLGVTTCGGLLLGPIVQKYAFGAYWTGFPLGGDLTDSKTLFVVLIWLAAFLLRKKSRWWTAGATVLMLIVYLIPHSLLGSELDYKTGKIETSKSVRD
ncbi:MAG: hypothetical protein MUC72_11200 [Acidobacteria bacterium]|jgi:hypothetical protein|nr:hypothetical protein [Acidobacteriota bacterium]